MHNKQNAAADLRRIITKYGFNQGIDIDTGTIISVKPLKILMDGRDVVLEKSDFRIARHLLKRSESVRINGYPNTIDYLGLQKADRVAFLYDTDQSIYFIFAALADEEEY